MNYNYKEFPTSSGRIKTTNTKYKINNIVHINSNNFTREEKENYITVDITKENNHIITDILNEETIYLHYTCKDSRIDYEPIYEIDNGGLVREGIIDWSEKK